jgi:hypothetical protein
MGLHLFVLHIFLKIHKLLLISNSVDKKGVALLVLLHEHNELGIPVNVLLRILLCTSLKYHLARTIECLIATFQTVQFFAGC